jgi:hypothetical protein
MMPYYKSTHLPGFGSQHVAVDDQGREHDLCVGDWTICQMRQYAMNGGFTEESRVWEDGLAVFRWHLPGAARDDDTEVVLEGA